MVLFSLVMLLFSFRGKIKLINFSDLSSTLFYIFMPSSGSREGVHWAAMKTIEELEELNHQLQVELRKARAGSV